MSERVSATSAILPLAVGAALWEVVARAWDIAFLPPLSAVLTALADLVRSGQILGNLATSLTNLVIGFAAALVAGIGAGALMGRFRLAAAVGEPYLHALLAAPSLIFVPIVFTLFGTSRITQIGAVFLNAVFVIAATTLAGVRQANPALVAMATAFGASERQVFWKVRWPAAWPLLTGGLRVSTLLAVKGMINGEMFIAFVGLGALARMYGGRFEAAPMLAIILVIVVVALACASIAERVSRRLVRS